jgi:hypothetical protein
MSVLEYCRILTAMTFLISLLRAKTFLSDIYFLWKGNYYEQKEGAAIGSPLSPVIANLFMETFEQEAFELAPLKPKLWKRYVDDTFVVWPHGRESLDQFLNHLNSLHSSIKFTMEIEENNQIPFFGCVGDTGRRPASSHSLQKENTF